MRKEQMEKLPDRILLNKRADLFRCRPVLFVALTASVNGLRHVPHTFLLHHYHSRPSSFLLLRYSVSIQGTCQHHLKVSGHGVFFISS